jgi:hypothetical protein
MPKMKERLEAGAAPKGGAMSGYPSGRVPARRVGAVGHGAVGLHDDGGGSLPGMGMVRSDG